MNLLDRYHSDLEQGGFIHDPAQEAILRRLELLYEDLQKPPSSQPKKKGLLSRFMASPSETQSHVKGLYVWGGVGRGKTYLMDMFYDCLPIEEKLRMHFHRFMQRTHAELASMSKEQDPLAIIADRFAKKYRVLCFDEFFVSDITDAMILGRLMQALFDRGITLVATSNIAPDGLYKDGLQRARFIPAIEALKARCDVLALDTDTDYRLRELEQAEIYHVPLDAQADQNLIELFDHMATSTIDKDYTIVLEDRAVKARQCTDGIVWFDYRTICDIPRGAADYIEIARLFHTVFVSNVEIMTDMQNDLANRFINLVDEMYDRKVNLVISAQARPHELYQGKKLAFQFDRTISRLLEMQSHEYLEQPHLP